MSFTCPRCWRTSHNPNDEREGFCGYCDDFTGGLLYGNQRYSSSGDTPKSDREMQVCQEPEEGKTKLPEVQGDGENNRLPELRRSGMGRSEESSVSEVRSQRMPLMVGHPTPPVLTQPNVFRYYIGAIAVGIAAGIGWTRTISIFVRHPYDDAILLSIVAGMLLWQCIYLIHEHKRLKIVEAEIKAQWETLKMKYPEYPWDDVRPKL
jgi:hypothetical protein